MPHEVVFLLDVDNTLLDNDSVERDLREHLEQAFEFWSGGECGERKIRQRLVDGKESAGRVRRSRLVAGRRRLRMMQIEDRQ